MSRQMERRVNRFAQVGAYRKSCDDRSRPATGIDLGRISIVFRVRETFNSF